MTEAQPADEWADDPEAPDTTDLGFEEANSNEEPVSLDLLPKLRRATSAPVVAVLQSADLDVRTCRHEIAYALAAFAGIDIANTELPVEFEQAAEKVLGLVRVFPKCKMKGAA